MENEFRPSIIQGLWALTVRELKKWLKDPVMLIMFVLQPLIWMGLLGKAMNIGGLFSAGNIDLPTALPIPGSFVIYPPGTDVIINGTAISQMFTTMGNEVMKNTFGIEDYFSFMAVGMVSMIVMMTTTFSGMSIVWDRRLGFLDKIISTPVSRAAIIFSKVLNATLRAMFQATVILALAYLLGLRLHEGFGLLNILGVYAAIFLLSVGLSSVFLAFSLRTTRIERPMQFVSLITMPLMFASNIFFPVKMMPDWMQVIAKVNPLTYMTDAVRQLTILPLDTKVLVTDFSCLGIFALVLATMGIVLAWRYLTR